MRRHSRRQLMLMFGVEDGQVNPAFDQLWTTIKTHLRDEPIDSTGVIGIRHGGIKYTDWVLEYLDSGIGEKYWGPGTNHKWKMDIDRDRIVGFFKQLMVNAAQEERQKRHRAGLTKGILRQGGMNNLYVFGVETGGKLVQKKPQKIKSENVEGQAPQHPHSQLCPMPKDPGGICLRKMELNTPYPPAGCVHPTSLMWGVPEVAKYSSNTPDPTTIHPSVGRYTDEGGPSTLLGRPQFPGATPQHTGATDTNINSDLLYGQGENGQLNNRVFETRFGDDATIAFLFAPCSITFQQFFDQLCKVWKKDATETMREMVNVKVSIAGAGEYHLSYGRDRTPSWMYIMMMAQIRPKAYIQVAAFG